MYLCTEAVRGLLLMTSHVSWGNIPVVRGENRHTQPGRERSAKRK